MKSARFALAALAVWALSLSAAGAQGPLKRLAARFHGDPVTVAPTCTGPNCAAAFPQAMPGPGHVTHVQPPAVAPAPKAAAKAVGQAAPPAAAGHGKPGPAFCAIVRANARQALRAQGKSFAEAWRLAADLTDDVIATAMPDAVALSGLRAGDVPNVSGQLGDGSFLKMIMDFLSSPLGQALIKALLDLLLHSLVDAQPCWPAPGNLYTAGCPPGFVLAV